MPGKIVKIVETMFIILMKRGACRLADCFLHETGQKKIRFSCKRFKTQDKKGSGKSCLPEFKLAAVKRVSKANSLAELGQEAGLEGSRGQKQPAERFSLSAGSFLLHPGRESLRPD